ncbi:hypothetical protein LSH36_234g03029 [Paralvinella palmiformis]|uniref:CAP-Gly domain-containing protein n=1 Tax=Paralvinella palmiformis TaxID=53620 RepID=A0AAD9N5E8_9ANNE|nr:hypothetical protein LSH36_234g03029 [Paralvinella palmiformis]
MKDEVLIISSENKTLKRLLAAKDIILREKILTIQNLQNALKDHVTPLQFRNIMRSVELQGNDLTESLQTRRRYSDTAPGRSLETNSTNHAITNHQSPDQRSSNRTRLLNTILKENNSRMDTSAPQRPKTAIVKPRMYQNSFSNFRSDSPTSSDVTSTTSDVSSGLRRTQSMRGPSISGSRSTVTSSSIDCIHPWTVKRGDNRANYCNGGSDEYQHKVAWSDRHARNMESLELGNRIVYEVVPKKGEQQSKDYNTGVVKYVGLLDNERDPMKIYVGIKLDEPDGDTDGLYKGKRYFRVSGRHGKFIRIERIRSIFDKQTGEFKSTEDGTRSSQSHHSRQHKAQ